MPTPASVAKHYGRGQLEWLRGHQSRSTTDVHTGIPIGQRLVPDSISAEAAERHSVVEPQNRGPASLHRGSRSPRLASDLKLKSRLEYVQKELAHVSSTEYLDELVGTLGADPMTPIDCDASKVTQRQAIEA